MTAIDDFLGQKELASNSLAAYRYDLEQFRQLVDGEIESAKLKSYQQFLVDLKPAAQKRKLSAVNQFLYFLYETGQLKHYHKLSLPSPSKFGLLSKQPVAKRLDLSRLWQESDQPIGQLLALFIWNLGLLPTEILHLQADDVNLDFKVLTVSRGQDKRVLKLTDQLLPYLGDLPKQGFLFAKTHQPYSRQWFFNQLRRYLEAVDLPDMTAQKLREQYILSQIESGVNLEQIAKNLGLKSAVTLEKYLK